MELYILLKFSTLESNLHINEKLYNDLSEKFKKICFVKIFPKLRPFTEFKIFQIKERFSKIIKKIWYIGENEKQFRKILNKKTLLLSIILVIHLRFYLHFLIKKYSISNNNTKYWLYTWWRKSCQKENFYKNKIFFNKTSHKLFSLFLILKIFKPIDIRFISNKDLFLKIKNSTEINYKKNGVTNKSI